MNKKMLLPAMMIACLLIIVILFTVFSSRQPSKQSYGEKHIQPLKLDETTQLQFSEIDIEQSAQLTIEEEFINAVDIMQAPNSQDIYMVAKAGNRLEVFSTDGKDIIIKIIK